jgi:hypothetical protein
MFNFAVRQKTNRLPAASVVLSATLGPGRGGGFGHEYPNATQASNGNTRRSRYGIVG